ncbi:MAG TPA: endolytic transglycosylase MltG [Candidatus Paceibacterota bacterium]|nr:endolytic transglycosylase MltG [Candidatus Paceibacterota bacterium]
MDDNFEKIESQDTKINTKKWYILLVLIFVIILYFTFLASPFGGSDTIIHISGGQSINSLALELENKNIVKNDLTLKIFIKLLKKGQGIITGDYLIKKEAPVFVVAWQIGRGHYNLKPIKITIREGLTNEQIADILSDKLPQFNKELFLSQAKDKQGYLFPDTYFLFSLDQPDEIIKKLFDNFNNKIENVDLELKESNKSLSEIVIMASILEGEAGGKEDVEIISGILWKRISLNMPLQVDVDRWTYENKGLPIKPLNNPGLTSIKAAISPKASSYLYYLHDKNGKVHFAVSYDEHKQNINKYLK